jgi:hypothetical protein
MRPSFLHPRWTPGYVSSPQKSTLYTGPDVPTAYDPDWQHFTSLTPDQIAWFQAQPEWATVVANSTAFLQSKGMSNPFTDEQMNPPIIKVISSSKTATAAFKTAKTVS